MSILGKLFGKKPVRETVAVEVPKRPKITAAKNHPYKFFVGNQIKIKRKDGDGLEALPDVSQDLLEVQDVSNIIRWNIESNFAIEEIELANSKYKFFIDESSDSCMLGIRRAVYDLSTPPSASPVILAVGGANVFVPVGEEEVYHKYADYSGVVTNENTGRMMRIFKRNNSYLVVTIDLIAKQITHYFAAPIDHKDFETYYPE